MTPARPSPERTLRGDAARNRQRLVDAALVVLHRDGPGVPMASIAAEAGVGVGTLYRHFATREDLLDELTFRSFDRMLAHLTRADQEEGSASEALRRFLTDVVADRDSLLLPGTGGPAVSSERTRRAQRQHHAAIRALLARGAADGTIRRDVDVFDIAWLGVSLAPPGRSGAAWERVAARLLDTYVAGLGVP